MMTKTKIIPLKDRVIDVKTESLGSITLCFMELRHLKVIITSSWKKYEPYFPDIGRVANKVRKAAYCSSPTCFSTAFRILASRINCTTEAMSDERMRSFSR